MLILHLVHTPFVSACIYLYTCLSVCAFACAPCSFLLHSKLLHLIPFCLLGYTQPSSTQPCHVIPLTPPSTLICCHYIVVCTHLCTYLSTCVSNSSTSTHPLTLICSARPHTFLCAMSYTFFSVLCKLFFQVYFAVYLETYSCI